MADPASLAEHLAILATTEDGGTFHRALKSALELTAYPAELPLPEDLTPDQRRLAEVLATRSGVRSLSTVAMPYDVQFRRRWLGLDAPGELEKRHAFRTGGTSHDWPLWKIWKTVGDDPAKGKGISALGLSTVQLLDAYIDQSLWSPYSGLQTSPLYDHVKRLGSDGGAWARARLDQMASWRVPEPQGDGSVRWTIARGKPLGFATFEPTGDLPSKAELALLTAIARAGETIEPAWERLVPFTNSPHVAEIIAAVPAARREAAMLEAAGRGVSKDALFAIFTLWPSYPYPSLAAWVDALLADPRFASSVDKRSLQEWRADWAKLTKKTPPTAEAGRGEPPAAKPVAPAKRTAEKTPTKKTPAPKKATTKKAPAPKKAATKKAPPRG
jgi:hypothetical protein